MPSIRELKAQARVLGIPEYWNLPKGALSLAIKEARGDSTRHSALATLTEEGARPGKETPAGKPDLLTDSHIIMVCHWRRWATGLRALALTRYFPRRDILLALWGGEPPPDQKATILDHCREWGITIRWM